MPWWSAFLAGLERELAGLQVGVYGSGGSPYHHLALAALFGATPRPVRSEDIAAGVLEQLDVLIFPGGGFQAMAGMLTPLGTEGATRVEAWVARGGMYIGSCAGSFLPVNVGEGYWQAHQEARCLHMVDVDLANGSDSIFEGLTSPGVGKLNVRLEREDHWLTEGMPVAFDIIHYNGPFFSYQTKPHHSPFAAPRGIAKPVAMTDEFTPSEGFMGEVTGTTLLEWCVARGAYNVLEAPYGQGSVVLFGSHPEFGFDVLQLGWQQPVRMIANAFKFQASRRKGIAPSPATVDAEDQRQQLAMLAASFEQIAQGFEKLLQAERHAWFGDPLPSFLGRSAEQLWQEASQLASQVALRTSRLLALLSQKSCAADFAIWLDNPAHEHQDVGFMGLIQLSELIQEQLKLSLAQLEKHPIVLEHAYDGFGQHPYQIAVSSYLSAAGLTAGAQLMAVSMAKLSQQDEFIPFDHLFC